MKWKHTIESYTATNPARAMDPPITRLFAIDHQGRRADDGRWAVAVRTILAAFLISVAAASIYAGETTYNFRLTGTAGEVLGSGKIRLPFRLGDDGKGTADWQFTATRAAGTNGYWKSAKARLSSGRGKASAGCKESWFTLDFNPGWADNNVTVSWALDKQEPGTLYFVDFSGRHPCASFQISRPAKRDEAANPGQHEAAIVGYWQLGDAQSFWEFRADGGCQSHGEIASKVTGRYKFLGRDKVRVDIAGDVQPKMLVFSLRGDELTLSEGQMAMKFHRVPPSAIHLSDRGR